MPKSGKVKLVENSFFKNCTIITNDNAKDYTDEKRCVVLSNCTIGIENDSCVSKGDDGCLLLHNCAITIKPIVYRNNKRIAMADAIAPIMSDDETDGGAECELA